MKLTFLGTGTSTGVPSIACECETCTSDDPRDKRLRVSIVIEHAGQSVLIDTSSDFRQQALRYGLKRLDAVLITHCHADHIFGLDDIRPLNFRYGALGLYANERAWVDIRRIFKYIFEPSHFGGGLPQVVLHTVVPGAQFCLEQDLLVTPLEVIHGRLPVMAYRLNDFAYATDLS
ncbi:MAG: MBL fold metallo-hydrolase, partial [Acidobacteria bacterium]|nr:MBL fold metallo-hydrolase [Acidobacteriota bacterium]